MEDKITPEELFNVVNSLYETIEELKQKIQNSDQIIEGTPNNKIYSYLNTANFQLNKIIELIEV